jgi:hypothetical protein
MEEHLAAIVHKLDIGGAPIYRQIDWSKIGGK